MTKPVKKYLVECVNYNGYKNVRFMMRADDFRISPERDDPGEYGYRILDRHPTYDHKRRTLRTIYGTMRVFSDWSVRPVFEEEKA